MGAVEVQSTDSPGRGLIMKLVLAVVIPRLRPPTEAVGSTSYLHRRIPALHIHTYTHSQVPLFFFLLNTRTCSPQGQYGGKVKCRYGVN